MKRLSLVPLAAVLCAALFPGGAPAKGPIEASLDGPGLGTPIRFGGWDEEAPLAPGAPLMDFAEATGFFPAVFERQPDPMLPGRPKGDLGPRYVVSYLVPGPYGEEWHVLQDLYPYAEPNPVTYMAPGQRVHQTQTRGGWFAATSPLKDQLVAAGLPESPPSAGDASSFPWPIVAAGVMGTLLLAAALAAIVIRRRPEASTAATAR